MEGRAGADVALMDVARDLPQDRPTETDAAPDGSDSGEPVATETRIFPVGLGPDLDLLFVIDDSPGMLALQEKFAAALPAFMGVLQSGAGGLPDLHVGVVSTSLGAGVYGNVPGCAPSSAGNRNGELQHLASCTQLHAGASFLSSVAAAAPASGRINNFDGDLSAVLACLTRLGDGGCEFEHPFEAAKLALQRTYVAGDRNAGFLRPNAHLAVVMVTNEDDCSVPEASMLFDPAQQTLLAPRGGLHSYRCNEFGHRCASAPPPHQPPASRQTLADCHSAEDGVLVTVESLVGFLRSLKPHQNMLLAAAVSGPPAPYVVEGRSFLLPGGGASSETQPSIVPSCSVGAMEFAAPAVRIHEWANAFGANGVFETICAPNFEPGLRNIAAVISRSLNRSCIEGPVLKAGDGRPDCQVALRRRDAQGMLVEVPVPACDSTPSVVPCWRLGLAPLLCPSGPQFQLCFDASCAPSSGAGQRADAVVSCSVVPRR